MKNTFLIPVECKLSTAEQTREMDSKTIHEFGIDSFTLMEMAASSAAGHIKNLQGSDKTGLYICGKGNNAGDALAVARYLVNEAQHRAVLFFVLGSSDLSPDAAKNLSLLEKMSEHGARIDIVDNPSVINDHSFDFDYVVDGIFGTGLNSDLRSPLPEIVERINSLSTPVYSMDVPSGLHADTGQVLKACIKADYTFTFGSNKTGLHWGKAGSYTGNIVFCNLPFPSHYRNWEAVLINQKLMDLLPDIKREARHKYDGGVVHILAGSDGLTGAAIMAAKSAWKQGAGAVFMYAPKALLPVYEATLPNIIKMGIGKNSDSYFKPEHAEQIIGTLKNKPGVLLAGPGIGTATETGECLLSILKEHTGFTILDADALSFWESLNGADISINQKKNWLLTPHIGEASNYLEGRFNNDYNRFSWAREFSDQTRCSLLIKGNPTIMTFAEGNSFITGYDTTVFSRAGFGDVLSGALASFAAISENPELASVTALYNGYKKSLEFKANQSFGPEHLI